MIESVNASSNFEKPAVTRKNHLEFKTKPRAGHFDQKLAFEW